MSVISSYIPVYFLLNTFLFFFLGNRNVCLIRSDILQFSDVFSSRELTAEALPKRKEVPPPVFNFIYLTLYSTSRRTFCTAVRFLGDSSEENESLLINAYMETSEDMVQQTWCCIIKVHIKSSICCIIFQTHRKC